MRGFSLIVTRIAWITTALVVLVASGVAWTTYQDLDSGVRRSRAIPEDAPRSTDGFTVLLIGLTTRRDLDGGAPSDEVMSQLHAGDVDRGGYNANTLILVHVPADGGPATAMSVPRDNYAVLHGVPGTPRERIKEAYGRAKEAEEDRLIQEGGHDAAELEWLGREAGRRAQVATVREFVGMPVDALAELSLAGFYHLADSLDGVDVCLNQATADHEFSGADFPAGRQRLDAAQALAFVRQRHGLPNGDLDRTRRQQAFLKAVLSRVKEQGVAALGPVVSVAKQNVVLSDGWDVLDLGGRVTGVRFLTLPITGDPDRDGQEAMRGAVDVALGRATPPPPPPPPPSPDASPTPPPPPSVPPSVDGIPCVD
ncbi:Cell envelope-related transcriptional attenuator [Saccharothrix espanaensis DSM 44229]|uniref:Cell envelope-related transcriptional attenuator n=1 Tax=Saccharothrix espanaensis (strain ATCC 51144 / DSM 44229 / JCM 9112 / NBRC 15066 / NRRL 15764) TaxID=1179773 RepID=K0JVN3_SACES|nr:Cell envelope-related transcriptional attenuator [Saccharothrix espanaensis DSM 44229]